MMRALAIAVVPTFLLAGVMGLTGCGSVRMGMAGHCGIANRTVQSGDKLVNIQIKSCQILDHNGAVVGYEYVH